ncbi:MAG: hypothetical protein WBS54_07110 [Acidobacteriota bacterium]
MPHASPAATLLLLLLVGHALQIAVTFPRLPASVAMHYGPTGKPGLFAPRALFLAIWILIVGSVAAATIAAGVEKERWMGCGVLGLFILLFHAVRRASLSEDGAMEPWAMMAILGYVATLVVVVLAVG